jgi:hypothetical protein
LIDSAGRAILYFIDPATGNSLANVSFSPPVAGSVPVGCAALADGTFRLLWRSATGSPATLLAVDAAGNSIAMHSLTYQAPYYPYAYAKKSDGSARLLWTGAVTSGTSGYRSVLMPLTAADELDTTAAAKTFDRPGTAGGRGYSVAPDGSARLLWSGGPSAPEVWVLNASDEMTAKTLLPRSDSMRNGTSYSWRAISYAVGAGSNAYIGWTYSDATSPFNEALVCTYAHEDDVTTLPDVDGWGPGMCKRTKLDAAAAGTPTIALVGFGLAPP